MPLRAVVPSLLTNRRRLLSERDGDTVSWRRKRRMMGRWKKKSSSSYK